MAGLRVLGGLLHALQDGVVRERASGGVHAEPAVLDAELVREHRLEHVGLRFVVLQVMSGRSQSNE